MNLRPSGYEPDELPDCSTPHLRVHDLKHTFGRRLRAAGVPLETRKVLLGHRNGDITSHYSAPVIAELLAGCEPGLRSESRQNPVTDDPETKNGLADDR